MVERRDESTMHRYNCVYGKSTRNMNKSNHQGLGEALVASNGWQALPSRNHIHVPFTCASLIGPRTFTLQVQRLESISCGVEADRSRRQILGNISTVHMPLQRSSSLGYLDSLLSRGLLLLVNWVLPYYLHIVKLVYIYDYCQISYTTKLVIMSSNSANSNSTSGMQAPAMAATS